jgi:NTP pyrophosphohydrolases including oxidative damage repair enzymes
MHRSLAAVLTAAQDGGMRTKRYRPNVAAILQRRDGFVLIGQRSDFPGSWQFPQGGIDEGESPEEALHREVFEEVGIAAEAYRVSARSGPHRYDFPAGPDRRGFDGQEQIYFLCSWRGAPAPDLGGTCGEFSALRWVELPDFPLHLAPPMKREVYRTVLEQIFAR